MDKEKFVETECSCNTCQNMCKTQPCLGTPEDIVKIIMAGHSKKVAMSSWMVGIIAGVTNDSIDMVQPKYIDGHGCAFLDDNNLCTLHDSGLKPTEGKLSHHTDAVPKSFTDTMNFKVAMSWVDKDGINDVINSLLTAERKLLSDWLKK